MEPNLASISSPLGPAVHSDRNLDDRDNPSRLGSTLRTLYLPQYISQTRIYDYNIA